MPDEDTNNDGMVNVMDCRALPPTLLATTVIDPAATDPTLGTGGIVHQHSRTAYTSYKPSPNSFDLYTGTSGDYLTETFSGSYNNLDVYLADPVPDTCGLWKWYTRTSAAGTIQQLLADDAFAYSTSHHSAVSLDSDGNEHYGGEACTLSCLSDQNCVGASYAIEITPTSNAVICKRLQKSENGLAESSEFLAVETVIPGWVAANMDVDFLSNDIIGVCEQ